MNEQKIDSVSEEPLLSVSEVSKTPDLSPKTHKGVLDSITSLWHKKSPSVSTLQNPIVSAKDISIEHVETLGVPDASTKPLDQTLPDPEKSYFHISEKIAHIFHKKSSSSSSESILMHTDTLEKTTNPEILDTPNKTGEPETNPMMDEKFARLLKYDTTYHSMIRSEDIKNIQLQLSMRYMLLMLAIFIVIAWVVNNRVIMFGFSDFPFLARTRDALFVLLTGLFSLTVYFGASVWLRRRFGTIILQILAIVLFLSVLVNIYLPFWK